MDATINKYFFFQCHMSRMHNNFQVNEQTGEKISLFFQRGKGTIVSNRIE